MSFYLEVRGQIAALSDRLRLSGCMMLTTRGVRIMLTAVTQTCLRKNQ